MYVCMYVQSVGIYLVHLFHQRLIHYLGARASLVLASPLVSKQQCRCGVGTGSTGDWMGQSDVNPGQVHGGETACCGGGGGGNGKARLWLRFPCSPLIFPEARGSCLHAASPAIPRRHLCQARRRLRVARRADRTQPCLGWLVERVVVEE